MKLAEWARKNNIHPRTAERWFHNGTLPVNAMQLDTGTILILEDKIKKTQKNKKVALYARVSTNDQKEDLQRQLERLKLYCSKKGYIVNCEELEIASGMNDKRKKLNKLLADSTIDLIVVEHRDRLTRFGFEMIKSTLNAHNRDIEIINELEYKEDIVQDFVDIITSMCSRIYGKRSAKNKKEQLVQVIEDEEN